MLVRLEVYTDIIYISLVMYNDIAKEEKIKSECFACKKGFNHHRYNYSNN